MVALLHPALNRLILSVFDIVWTDTQMVRSLITRIVCPFGFLVGARAISSESLPLHATVGADIGHSVHCGAGLWLRLPPALGPSPASTSCAHCRLSPPPSAAALSVVTFVVAGVVVGGGGWHT